MNVIVVRDRGKCEDGKLSARQRFRLKRQVVYAFRGLRDLGISWTGSRNPLSGLTNYRLEAGGVVATAYDAGLMSFGNVEVDGRSVHQIYPEESFAGHGGVQITILRLTQHVLRLVHQRAREVADAFRDHEAEPF